MNYPLCNHNACINWKEGRCSIKDPEKEDDSCLYYEDIMNSLRLKADALKGTLG